MGPNVRLKQNDTLCVMSQIGAGSGMAGLGMPVSDSCNSNDGADQPDIPLQKSGIARLLAERRYSRPLLDTFAAVGKANKAAHRR